MAEKTPLSRLLEVIPESAKRLFGFILSPTIPDGPVSASPLSMALVDLVVTATALSTLISVGSSLLPGVLSIEPDKMINWPMFAVLLVGNSLAFGGILYSLLLLPLSVKGLRWHPALFYHSLRFFGVQNALVSILFIIALNRVVTTGTITTATGVADAVTASVVAIAVFGVTVWLLVRPVAKYLNQHFGRALSNGIATGAVIVASIVNPVVASGYFNNVIVQDAFCSALVDARFGHEIESGKYSRDCLIGKCLGSRLHREDFTGGRRVNF